MKQRMIEIKEYLKEIFDFINKFEEDYPVRYPKLQTKEEKYLKQKIFNNIWLNTPKGRIFKRLSNLRRYLRKKGIKENFTKEEWLNKIKKTGGICPSCKKFVGRFGLELDHIIPLSKAPKKFIYTINDIQPLCKSCNTSKGNKLI